MSDKTILDRGITTFTRPEPLPFDFDNETKKLELVQYYQYCKDNSLISGVGEQSRLALIRKTFTHLGGIGDTSELTMRSWLQSVLPSSETSLETLWASYFTKYASTPDAQAVTYSGLSVEAGYRKFLREFIGNRAHYSDVAVTTESLKTNLNKSVTEVLTTTESLSTFLTFLRSVSDTCSASETVVILLNNAGYFDNSLISESYSYKITKQLFDTMVVGENIETVGGTSSAPTGKSLAEGLQTVELLNLTVIKVLSDTLTSSEELAHMLDKNLSEVMQGQESISLVMDYQQGVYEFVDLGETIALMPQQFYTSILTTSEEIIADIEGFGAGGFGEFSFNA